MDRLSAYFRPRRRRPSQAYEPLDDERITSESVRQLPPFSWLEYAIFVLLGIAMLWAW